MLIGDSPSCPHCGHVLDAQRAASEFLDLIPSAELQVSESDDELPCKQCGEMVRIGLVRCWHCGAFTNSEIEATYHRMQAHPAPIMYSDVTQAPAEHPPAHAVPFAPVAEDDGGFELGEGYGVAAGGNDRAGVAAQQPATATYNYRTAPPEAAAASSDDDDFTLATEAPAAVVAVNTNSAAQSPAVNPSQEQTHPAAAGEYDQATYDQQAYDQQAYDAQQYQIPWGYKLSADGTAYEIDYEAWQQAGLDPNAQPGEPGYYDPYAGQGYEDQQYSADGSAVAAEAVPPEGAGGQLPEPPDVAHSVSTAGETLLAAAMEEEKESAKLRRPGARRKVTAQDAPPGSFLVYCPNGHRVQVQERHRGRAGRCPSCKAVFFVPALDPTAAPPEGTEGAAAATPESGKYQVGDYNNWMFEMRLHTVSPLKLKLKPGAMAAEYDVADVAFSAQDMLVMTVFKRGGTFAAMQEKKKKPAARQAIGDYLQTKKPASGLPAPFQTLVTQNDANLLKIVQPAIPGEESIFAGIPVFGPGRIVVRLPAQLEGNSRAYLSFSLSEFREFARLLEQVFGIAAFGQELGIPLTDTISNYKCHYSETELPTLEYADFYKEDPALKPIVLGRKCAGCGLVVSEDARKKEKIGGKNDASIAKAICPKCKKKFGDITLYGLDPNAKPVEFGKLPAEK